MLVADLSVLWMLVGEAMVLRVMMWVEGLAMDIGLNMTRLYDWIINGCR